MEKAYKYRIYPNKKQKEIIAKTFGSCRFVYNKYLAKRSESLETKLALKRESQSLITIQSSFKRFKTFMNILPINVWTIFIKRVQD